MENKKEEVLKFEYDGKIFCDKDLTSEVEHYGGSLGILFVQLVQEKKADLIFGYVRECTTDKDIVIHGNVEKFLENEYKELGIKKIKDCCEDDRELTFEDGYHKAIEDVKKGMPKGKWIEFENKDNGIKGWKCSHCGCFYYCKYYPQADMFPYCPNCGNAMEVELWELKQ